MKKPKMEKRFNIYNPFTKRYEEYTMSDINKLTQEYFKEKEYERRNLQGKTNQKNIS